MSDDQAMMWDEVADIGLLLHELDDTAFDAQSLCAGWKVRDVLGHMASGHTFPMGTMLSVLARYRFNVTKASFSESPRFFKDKSAAEVRRFWDEVMVAQHPRKGIAKLIPARSEFVDHLVHNQDIRRPTGAARTIPSDRLVRALELTRSEASPTFNPKRKVQGLKLVASDIGWTAGDGPVVEGPGEAIVMAAAGRSVALDDLSGDGVSVLRDRVSTR